MRKNGKERTPTNPKACGRPRSEFDYVTAIRLAARMCSNRDIASIMGVDEATIRRRLKDDAEFAASIEKARAECRSSLLMKQFEVAMSGDRTMLIWCGKQHLGQSDKVEEKIEVTENVDTREELDNLLASIASKQTKKEGIS